MTLLSNDMAKAYFTNGAWEVRLTKGGKAIASITPAWSVLGSGAMTSARFVFDKFTTFDTLQVLRDGQIVDTDEIGGTVSLPPAAEWIHDLTVTMSDA